MVGSFTLSQSVKCAPHTAMNLKPVSHTESEADEEKDSSSRQVGSWSTPDLFLVNASTICISLKFCTMLPGFQK